MMILLQSLFLINILGNERVNDMKDNSNFSEKLCYYMQRNGFTQSGIAELMDVNRSSVSDWMNGISRPKKSNLVLLAQVLGTTTAELLGDGDIVNAKNHSDDFYFYDEFLSRFEKLNIAGKLKMIEVLDDYATHPKYTL